MKGRVGFGVAFAREKPGLMDSSAFGGQLEKWRKFLFFRCGIVELPKMYIAETIRTDFYKNILLVSARRRCQRLERIFKGISFRWGRRELLAVFVRAN